MRKIKERLEYRTQYTVHDGCLWIDQISTENGLDRVILSPRQLQNAVKTMEKGEIQEEEQQKIYTVMLNGGINLITESEERAKERAHILGLNEKFNVELIVEERDSENTFPPSLKKVKE